MRVLFPCLYYFPLHLLNGIIYLFIDLFTCHAKQLIRLETKKKSYKVAKNRNKYLIKKKIQNYKNHIQKI